MTSPLDKRCDHRHTPCVTFGWRMCRCTPPSFINTSSEYICTSLHVRHLLEQRQILFYKKFPQTKSKLPRVTWCQMLPERRLVFQLSWTSTGAPEVRYMGPGLLFFTPQCSQAGQRSSFVGLECAVRASSSCRRPLRPTQPHTAPNPGTLARSHRKLLADFSHIVTRRFVNSDECNQRRADEALWIFTHHLLATVVQWSGEGSFLRCTPPLYPLFFENRVPTRPPRLFLMMNSDDVCVW